MQISFPHIDPLKKLAFLSGPEDWLAGWTAHAPPPSLSPLPGEGISVESRCVCASGLKGRSGQSLGIMFHFDLFFYALVQYEGGLRRSKKPKARAGIIIFLDSCVCVCVCVSVPHKGARTPLSQRGGKERWRGEGAIDGKRSTRSR